VDAVSAPVVVLIVPGVSVMSVLMVRPDDPAALLPELDAEDVSFWVTREKVVPPKLVEAEVKEEAEAADPDVELPRESDWLRNDVDAKSNDVRAVMVTAREEMDSALADCVDTPLVVPSVSVAYAVPALCEVVLKLPKLFVELPTW
jgi:hypothetical protein